MKQGQQISNSQFFLLSTMFVLGVTWMVFLLFGWTDDIAVVLRPLAPRWLVITSTSLMPFFYAVTAIRSRLKMGIRVFFFLLLLASFALLALSFEYYPVATIMISLFFYGNVFVIIPVINKRLAARVQADGASSRN
jgi:hypothetical protein